jgi:hypothetical protein
MPLAAITTKENYMEIPLLGQGNAAERSNHNAPEPVRCRTAFLIFITEGGQVAMTPDINTPLVVERVPHADEALGAVAVVHTNLAAQQAGAITINGMVGMTQAAMNAQASQQVLKDPNLRVKG